MCIEFSPFLRVSRSYQGLDKLISQALTSAGLPNRTPTLTEAGLLHYHSTFSAEHINRGSAQLMGGLQRQQLLQKKLSCYC